jgi:hypothetical protein
VGEARTGSGWTVGKATGRGGEGVGEERGERKSSRRSSRSSSESVRCGGSIGVLRDYSRRLGGELNSRWTSSVGDAHRSLDRFGSSSLSTCQSKLSSLPLRLCFSRNAVLEDPIELKWDPGEGWTETRAVFRRLEDAAEDDEVGGHRGSRGRAGRCEGDEGGDDDEGLEDGSGGFARDPVEERDDGFDEGGAKGVERGG